MTRLRSVITGCEAGVFRLRLNRPQVHNAFDEELVEALWEAIETAAGDRSARIVVLEGEGASFCAGADVDWMRRQGEASVAENERSALRLAALYERLDTLALPLVARVQGPAVGGGVGLVAACDVAVASSNATFTLAEVRLGLVPAVISPYVLRKIGLSRSRELMLSGRKIGAAEALSIGLVHHLCEPAKLDEAVGGVAADLLRGGPEALGRVKRLLAEIRRPGLGDEEIAGLTAREIAAARASEEGRSGARAFLEKKPPPWAPGGKPAR